METNFNGKEIETEKELFDFAEMVKFPTHGLILRKSKNDTSSIIKGILDPSQLKEAFKKLRNEWGSIYAETDMRAMYNPSRMTVIEQATKKLIDKINSFCPRCSTPGFGITAVKKGLTCSLCGLPTNSTLSCMHSCKKCNFTTEEIYPHKKTTEDPMYCDHCNP
jgi:hypothetical protein